MRTLSSSSRIMGMIALIATAVLVLGGLYFVGHVSDLQRRLGDPATHTRASREIATIEQSLGFAGFLTTYRSYWWTREPMARKTLNEQAAASVRAVHTLRVIYAGNAAAQDALNEAASVSETFARAAKSAPPPSTLRGTAASSDFGTLPQPEQLEAAYLTLRTALDRLRTTEQSQQIGAVAYALNWGQILVIATICALIGGLLVAIKVLEQRVLQPLKTLERSFASAGDGSVTQRIWGTDRQDEFGSIARAGEKLRRSIERTAKNTIAERVQLHLDLDDQTSILLQRLAADVTQSSDALKAATAEFATFQYNSRLLQESALGAMAASTKGIDDTAAALHDKILAAAHKVQDTTQAIAERSTRFDTIATRFDESQQHLASLTESLKVQAEAASLEVSHSAQSVRYAANSVVETQAALAASLKDLGTRAEGTTVTVHTLAARLNETIGLVDERLGRKLAALDTLEQVIAQNFTTLHTKAEEAWAAIAYDVTSRPLPENDQLAASLARLDELAERLSRPTQEAKAPDLRPLATALKAEFDGVRSEIRDLAIRMTEERILASAGETFTPVAGTAPALTPTAPRTLADVPRNEILARLKDLAAEMDAVEAEEHAAPLKSALGKLANDAKDLAATSARTPQLKAVGRAFTEHADEIEAHLRAVDPSPALKVELADILRQLRTVGRRAQANSVKDAARLRESMIEIGGRAESIFGYLNRAPSASGMSEGGGETTETKTADLHALAKLIERLEAHADGAMDEGPSDLTSNTAINAVFDSIGRLNNIANALARAGASERPRRKR